MADIAVDLGGLVLITGAALLEPAIVVVQNKAAAGALSAQFFHQFCFARPRSPILGLM